MAPLFHLADLQAQAHPAESSPATPPVTRLRGARSTTRAARRNAGAAEALGPLEPGSLTVAVSLGQWSAADAVVHLVEQLATVEAPADLFFATWSISEKPLRQLWHLRERGLLRRIVGVIDHRATTRDANAVQLFNGLCEPRNLLPIHAKMTAVLTPTAGAALLGSGNMTQNPRIEGHTVIADRAVALWLAELVESLADGSHPFAAAHRVSEGARHHDDEG